MENLNGILLAIFWSTENFVFDILKPSFTVKPWRKLIDFCKKFSMNSTAARFDFHFEVFSDRFVTLNVENHPGDIADCVLEE